jgi:hypothetical protein
MGKAWQAQKEVPLVQPAPRLVPIGPGGPIGVGAPTPNLGERWKVFLNEARKDPTFAKAEASAYEALSQAKSIVGNTSPSVTRRSVPGTPGQVTGGNSTVLGKNMIEEMGLPRSQTWRGYQAQHIVPAELRHHPVLRKIGMNLDDASNGIFLPTPDKPTSSLPRHRGYHSIYNQAVERRLNQMDVTKSIPELEQEVHRLQQQLRHLLQKGTPLYPSQGATIELWERRLIR